MDDDEDERFVERQSMRRNLVAFWILGLCNNFAYVVMLSAAKDIIGESGGSGIRNGTSDECIDRLDGIKCSAMSTGAVLLADIIPSLIAKLISPFLLLSVAYSVRHAFVIFCQCASFLLVAFSNSFATSILGVAFASAGSGLGDVAYLSLTSHFHGDVVASWSSGTGGAGIVGALAFAVMTDHRLLGLSPRSALLLMLTVPAVFFYTFWKILIFPPTLRTFDIWRVSTYLVPRDPNRRTIRRLSTSGSVASASSLMIAPVDVDAESLETPLLAASSNRINSIEETALITGGRPTAYLSSRLQMIKPLWKFMIPLVIVYFGEYFINQGLLELFVFTCSQGFDLSPTSQYRWYQVLYQIGVFVSRSSAKIFPLSPLVLPILPILQLINSGYLFNKSMHPSSGHILFIFIMVFYEGLLGGAAYVNTFTTLHKTIQRNREFSMSFVALSDALGILMAGFTGIWAHNYICARFRIF